MYMDKPTKVKIGWKDVKIKYVDPSFLKNNVDVMDNTYQEQEPSKYKMRSKV